VMWPWHVQTLQGAPDSLEKRLAFLANPFAHRNGSNASIGRGKTRPAVPDCADIAKIKVLALVTQLICRANRGFERDGYSAGSGKLRPLETQKLCAALLQLPDNKFNMRVVRSAQDENHLGAHATESLSRTGSSCVPRCGQAR